MEYARMAELTTPVTMAPENQLADQLDDVKLEMRKFAARLDKMSTAAVSGAHPQPLRGDHRLRVKYPSHRKLRLVTDSKAAGNAAEVWGQVNMHGGAHL